MEKLHKASFAVIEDEDGRVLWKLRSDFNIWDLPGGKADPCDFEQGIWLPEQTCRREVFEETGCLIQIKELFGCFYTGALAHDIPSISIVFSACIIKGTLRCNEEAIKFGWFCYSKLPQNSFLIHKDIQRQFQNGKIDNWDLRSLIEEQRRVLFV